MANTPAEKSFFAKTKVLYTLLIIALVMGALIALSLTDRVAVTSEQIISFGEWVLAFLIGGHSAQRGASYIAQAIMGPNLPEPEPKPEDEEGDK